MSRDHAAIRVEWQTRRSIDRYLRGETSLNFLAFSLEQVIEFAEGAQIEFASDLREL